MANTTTPNMPGVPSWADQNVLSQGAQDQIQQYKQQYDAAKAAGDKAGMDAAHAAAEQVRAQYGYSGGADGSQYNQVSDGGIDWSSYDAMYLSPEDLAAVQQYKRQYVDAEARGDRAGMDAAHRAAEQIRAKYNYSGGTYGDQYIPWGGSNNTPSYQPVQPPTYVPPPYVETPQFNTPTFNPVPQANKDELKALLEQWKQKAEEQSTGQIDFAVQQAITELERALADAQPQFKEQAEAVALDEAQAMDNSALYAQLRGDKGGIGASQFNEIQATAAKNRQAVQQAQTKLSTDTARQIADLRAKGEFEKADSLLEISQNFLAQLMSLEQWAAEYNLNAAQFEASLKQWQAEFEASMKQWQADFELGQQQWGAQFELNQNQWNADFQNQQNQWNQEFGFAQNQWQTELDLKKKEQLASIGEALLGSGVMPNDEQLAALGLTKQQAQQLLQAYQLESAKKSSSTSSPGSDKEDDDRTTNIPVAPTNNSPYNYFNVKSVMNLGAGLMSYETLNSLVESGKVIATVKDGEIHVAWAPGWDATNWMAAPGNSMLDKINAAIAGNSTGNTAKSSAIYGRMGGATFSNKDLLR